MTRIAETENANLELLKAIQIIDNVHSNCLGSINITTVYFNVTDMDMMK